ncbi:hypothetical protein [Aliarcobacter butzleri]|uniref:hypothetical protein n=1 Tax=Aliarcobacter butzleri TaxID=28197 RepID=UPI00186A13D0|nr:hypothetical protein [Aliarcobacter butzleri]
MKALYYRILTGSICVFLAYKRKKQNCKKYLTGSLTEPLKILKKYIKKEEK